MSCTIVALPIALGWIMTAGTIGVAGLMFKNTDENVIENDFLELNEKFNCEETMHITENNIVSKEFETPFNDKEILLKTLTEHGIKDIEQKIDVITCKFDSYILQFNKKELDKPYFLTIYCDKNANTEEQMQNLSEEYSLNVQEVSYINLVENLKQNNLEIENEEVLDDNSIVLTINLD